MIKKLLGIGGLGIFVFCVVLGLNLWRVESQASFRDSKNTKYGMVMGPPFCNWSVKLPERVMSEDKSQAVVVRVQNPTKEECESSISLRAPGFDISPMKEEQKIALTPAGKGSLSWIITPRRTGSYQITVSDALNTSVLGVSVTNIFGFSSIQAKIFSVVGGLFGPMFTVPWWWDRLRGKPKLDGRKDEQQS